MIFRLVALLAVLLPSPALAWWEYGHETVASIALQQVAPQTRREVQTLLRQGRLLETPACSVATLELASHWADCIKGLGPRFDYAFSWHYQNVDVCKPFDLKAACKDGHCVSAQITRNARLLADQTVPPRERLMALAFLAHFVGDLHMPLHAGDRGDRGGNDVKAAYGIASRERLNLHSVWDGYLAERAISTPPKLVRRFGAEERAKLAAGTVEDWSRESWQASRDYTYATVLGDPCGPAPTERVTLSNEAIERLVPVVRLQIERGGARLARLLDEALGPLPGAPAPR